MASFPDGMLGTPSAVSLGTPSSVQHSSSWRTSRGRHNGRAGVVDSLRHAGGAPQTRFLAAVSELTRIHYEELLVVSQNLQGPRASKHNSAPGSRMDGTEAGDDESLWSQSVTPAGVNSRQVTPQVSHQGHQSQCEDLPQTRPSPGVHLHGESTSDATSDIHGTDVWSPSAAAAKAMLESTDSKSLPYPYPQLEPYQLAALQWRSNASHDPASLGFGDQQGPAFTMTSSESHPVQYQLTVTSDSGRPMAKMLETSRYSGGTLSGSQDQWQSSQDIGVVERWQLMVTGLLYPAARAYVRLAQDLELHQLWMQPHGSVRAILANLPASEFGTASSTFARLPDDDLEVQEGSRLQHFVAHPMGDQVAVIGLLASLVFLFDAFFTPIKIVSVETVASVDLRITLATTLFWMMDMVFQFFTGHENKLRTELRPHKVAKHYLRTWFPCDIIVLLLDVITLGCLVADDSQKAGSSSYSSITHIMTILTAAHVFRAHRVVQTWEAIFARIVSDHTRLAVKLLLLIVEILALAHQIACAWFALGTMSHPDTDITWLMVFLPDADGFLDQYMASMHWALTQFTPSTIPIGPSNLRERTFAVAVVCVALVIFTCFISHLTSLFNQMRTLTADDHRADTAMRHYIHKRGISHHLSKRIQHFVWKQRHESGHDGNLCEEDVPFFTELPQRLQKLLRSELYSRFVRRSTTLRFYARYQEEFVLNICASSAKECFVRALEDVFDVGQMAHGMYFVAEGTLRYIAETGHEHRSQSCEVIGETMDTPTSGVRKLLDEEDEGEGMIDKDSDRWVAEAALSIRWHHQGTFLGFGHISRIISVGTAPFLEFCERQGNPALRHLLRMHAIFTLSYMEQNTNLSRPMNDLDPCPEACREIVEKVFRISKLKTSA
eukprot:CAMPEP_0178411600 /NCGR_PEP_ID=MMETSP0689_2-20121128/21575_1 /TAXON_ID=160604 /ORGANISM="Amphidinium massartii, Strain CS-259" /LENGTH=891 /DNA_ID=CAMNT_0020032805 /DNA_START=34 /DNA_END=2705 /DNA_ORIENTATION=-